MSDLAFNLNGDPFEVPAHAAGWRVRRMKNKGAPEVVYGRNGQPLVLPIEADLDDVRAEVPAAGRYRLDPVDETNKPIANAPAGYVYVHELAPAPASTSSALGTASDNIIIEAMRMNAEIARSVVDRFPQMLEAAATLLRAADGAGLPARAPRVIDRDDDQNEDRDDDQYEEAAPPAGFDLNSLVAQVVPMLMAGMSGGKLPNLSAMLDWRKAAPTAEAAKATREKATRGEHAATPLPAIEQDKELANAAVEAAFPPIDPATMAHFISIQSVLDPKEAELARAVAADLSPAELRSWFEELKKLNVAQAVQKIRTLIAGNTEAVP